MSLYVKNGDEIQSLAGAIGSGLPIGSLIDVASNDMPIPLGYLKCDGSEFSEEEYPALYLYLGSTTLPTSISYNMSSTPDVAFSNRSDYRPANVTYYNTVQIGVEANKLNSDGFESDGIMHIEVDDWCYVWIQDTDGSIKGYAIGYRDNIGLDIDIPIKKGQKLYGLNRNGSGNPSASTEIANYDYTKIYIWYNHNYRYIKAVPGTLESESNTVYNNIRTYVENNTPLYTYNAEDQSLTITQKV